MSVSLGQSQLIPVDPRIHPICVPFDLKGVLD